MNKTKIVLLLFLVGIITTMTAAFVSAGCTYSAYENSTDFLDINQSEYAEIPMSTAELWTNFTFFTPRLNFSHIVYEDLDGLAAGENYTIQWVMIGDTYDMVNDTFILTNATVTIPRTNYTLASNNSNHTFIIQFLDSRYDGVGIQASWNRTFVKNVDDIFLNATGMTGMIGFAQFIQSNTPAAYGDSKLFRPHEATYYGQAINVTDWSVGWNVTLVTCTGDNVCENNPAMSSILFVITLLFSLAVLLFVAGPFVKNKIEEGKYDLKWVIVTFLFLLLGITFTVIIANQVANICW